MFFEQSSDQTLSNNRNPTNAKGQSGLRTNRQTLRRAQRTGRHMSKSLPVTNLPGAHWEPKTPFDLVVAYEDRMTRNRALHLYDHLAQQLLDDYDFKCAWWKFDHLAEPSLREDSIDDAAAANMVILSLHARPEIPEEQKHWVESWLAFRNQRKCALVAMIGNGETPPIDSTNMITWLCNAARLGRMDFFNHSFGVPTGLATPTFEKAHVVPGNTGPMTLTAGLPGQPIPDARWGSNE